MLDYLPQRHVTKLRRDLKLFLRSRRLSAIDRPYKDAGLALPQVTGMVTTRRRPAKHLPRLAIFMRIINAPTRAQLWTFLHVK